MKTDDFMAMKGAGYYSRATVGAKTAIDDAAALTLAALERRPPADDGTVLTVTDMGCADGGTASAMLGRVLGDLRRRCPSRPIQMIHTDLPHNDFSQLFLMVHGLTEAESYAAGIEGLHVYASATSFHRRIVPAGTLDVGLSATASHYVTEPPAPIDEGLHMVQTTGAVREAWRAKGAADWANFLCRRAEELRDGGFVSLLNFGIDEQGRWLGDTGGQSMFGTFDRLWRAMADEGAITSEEYCATVFPQVYREVAEFTAPFEPGGAAAGAGLALEHVDTSLTPCPFAADYAAHGDAAAFAAAYVPTLRSWSERVFLAGLSTDRAPEARAEIVDEFYGRYQAAVAAAPEGHGMDYVHCRIVARKR